MLARNGQFSLQYHDDNLIRGYASTSAGWSDANARLPSGRWVHYALSYDGSDIRLYFDGKIVSKPLIQDILHGVMAGITIFT